MTTIGVEGWGVGEGRSMKTVLKFFFLFFFFCSHLAAMLVRNDAAVEDEEFLAEDDWC